MKDTFKKLITGLIIFIFVFAGAGCGGGGGGGGGSSSSSSSGGGGGNGGGGTTTRDITRYALFVGINDYPGVDYDLNYCVNDTTDMKASLNGSTEWSGATYVTLTNSNAKKGNVESYIDTASTRVTSTGTFLFFFSGHGTHSGSTGYLVTYDGLTEAGTSVVANMISEDDLESWLAEFPSTTNKIVIMDACFSGNFIGKDLPPNTTIKFFPMPGSEIPYEKDFLKDITTVSNLFAMTAAAGDETCAESGALQNGIFTYYMVQGLGAGAVIGPADTNASDTITCLESYNYADPLATAFNAGQNAQYYDGATGLLIKQ